MNVERNISVRHRTDSKVCAAGACHAGSRRRILELSAVIFLGPAREILLLVFVFGCLVDLRMRVQKINVESGQIVLIQHHFVVFACRKRHVQPVVEIISIVCKPDFKRRAGPIFVQRASGGAPPLINGVIPCAVNRRSSPRGNPRSGRKRLAVGQNPSGNRVCENRQGADR